MALYAISDLHLSFGTDKPMDVFGGRWNNYEEKLFENWQKIVSNDDVVIINGDISWGMYLKECYEDFKYIDRLNGTKLFLKGNHDYWWDTVTKNTRFCTENNFNSIIFLQNNHYLYENVAICGSRGWQKGTEEDNEKDKKIYNREIERLKLSLNSVDKSIEKIVALHYPPDETFRDILKDYNIKLCLYGHLHGANNGNVLDEEIQGIKYKSVSADRLNFIPFNIDNYR